MDFEIKKSCPEDLSTGLRIQSFYSRFVSRKCWSDVVEARYLTDGLDREGWFKANGSKKAGVAGFCMGVLSLLQILF